MNIATRLAAVALLSLPISALAQIAGSEQRSLNQQQRIDQGVRSGELTQREAAKLERGQAHVDRMQTRAARDGVVSAQERERIQSAQNRQSRKIYRQKHDGQRR
jgi:hypothetical protein